MSHHRSKVLLVATLALICAVSAKQENTGKSGLKRGVGHESVQGGEGRERIMQRKIVRGERGKEREVDRSVVLI